jgi:hypothetical protein
MPQSAASEALPGPFAEVPPSQGSSRGRKKKLTTLENFEENNHVSVSKVAEGGSKSDLYLAHLNMILKQITFRLNMYKLSADYYDAKVISPLFYSFLIASCCYTRRYFKNNTRKFTPASQLDT